MERCMGEMNLRGCLIYLDDIVAFSSGFEEHLEKLEPVFKRLHDHKLKLKGSKCDFFRSQFPIWVIWFQNMLFRLIRTR